MQTKTLSGDNLDPAVQRAHGFSPAVRQAKVIFHRPLTISTAHDHHGKIGVACKERRDLLRCCRTIGADGCLIGVELNAI
jgi:hypothetical protein